jgi:hypothetical protein
MIFLLYTLLVMVGGAAIGHLLYSPTWSLKPTAGLRKIREFLKWVDSEEAAS